MLKRLWWIFALLSIAIGAQAVHIDYIPNSDDVQLRNRQDIYYHSETDDQHWYGTDRWAVYFDLEDYFTGTDEITINPEEIVFYCPNSLDGDTVTFIVCANGDNNQPDVLNAYSQETLTGNLLGWQTVQISTAIDSLSTFWVVIDYPTEHHPSSPEQSRYIAASATGGENSFYWDPDYGDGYFFNMAVMGFQSEFLLGVNGSLNFPNEYREIMVDYVSANEENNSVTPYWSITNQSAVTITDITVSYSVELPNDADNEGMEDSVRRIMLGPGETLVDTSSTSLDLGLLNSQMYVMAEVFYPGIDTLDANTANNSKTVLFDIFRTPRNHVLVENALRTSDISTRYIWDIQSSDLQQDSVIVLNYFPDISDSLLYAQDALDRFNHYDLFGYPATVTQGIRKIVGYTDEQAYADSLDTYYREAIDRNTFMSLDGYDSRTWDNGEYICRVYMANQDTYVFTSYLHNLVFYAALVEEGITLDGETIPGYTLLEFLPDSTGIIGLQNSDMIHDTTSVYNFDFDINNIDTIQDSTDHLERLSVLMFLQYETATWSRENWIEYAVVVPLTEFLDNAVGTHDDTVPYTPDVKVYPNPFRPGQSVRIDVPQLKSRSLKGVTVDVYNIRGQRVRRIVREANEIPNGIYWDGRNQKGNIVSTGVYLMRIETRDGNASVVTHKNCLLIK